MMTAKDIDDLFALLKLYFPNSPKTGSKKLKNAWLLVLEPYGRGDVKQALLKLLRTNAYFPDPQKIAALCPPPPEENRQKKPPQVSQLELEEMRKFRAKWDRLVALRREAGIPATIREALAAGMVEEDWLDILAERGLAWM